MLRIYRPDDDDEGHDPEARPTPKHPEHDPYDENAYDEDAEALEQMEHEHDVLEAMEAEHEREVAERKTLGKSGPNEQN
jgi:hypothetical protein